MATLFGTKPTQSLADKLTDIKSMFKAAYDKANALDSEMVTEIDTKESQIAALNSEIDTIKVTQEENSKFMSNLAKLI